MKLIEYGKNNREVIMLLHGGGLSWWNYRAEAELLCDRWHVVLPILDGHAESGHAFVSIEENAARVISLIDSAYGGHVLCIGGLSLGAQILAEMLAQRQDICRYAVIESASAIPSPMTNALIRPAFSLGYSLIRMKWFAGMQFRYLRIREDLFEDYIRDTAKITKSNMIAFLKANTAYAPKPALRQCRVRARVIVGEKEQSGMLRSARLLREQLPESTLEVKKGLFHGEFSLNHPEEFTTELCQMIV